MFLLILAAPFAVPFLYIHYQKKKVRKEVKEMIISGLKRDQLTVLTFSLEETKTLLDWQHSREFMYKDEMYDIVETEDQGDSVSYWCWHDREETHLHKKLDDLVTQSMAGDPQNREKQQKISNYLKIHYLPSGYDWNPFNDPFLATHFHETIPTYQSILIPPPSPPPESYS